MRVRPRSHAQLAAIAAAALGLAAAYLFAIQQEYRAAVWSRSRELAGLRHAVELAPGNAGYRHRLGRMYLFSEQDADQALIQLQRATELNPTVPWYWLDLAAAYRLHGDEDAYRTAVERAADADPRTPMVAWEAGNLWLSEGQTDRALASFRVVVENDPASMRRALDLCWRATQSVPTVLAGAVGKSTEAHLAFIDVLTARDLPEQAMAVWAHVAEQPVVPRSAYPFVFWLLHHQEPEKAAQVWRDLARHHPGLLPRVPVDELPVVNPGFEEDLQNGGLSWYFEPPAGVTMQIDTDVHHGGARSLQIEFDGSGMQQVGIMQYIPVEPSRRYELIAAARAEDIESASGPQLYVQDAYDHAVLGAGEEWRHSTAWHEEKIPFATGAKTRLIALRVVRLRPESSIHGRLWLDDVRLLKR